MSLQNLQLENLCFNYVGFISLILCFYQTAVTDGNHLEVKVKPVPRPRSKVQPKAVSSTDGNILDSVDRDNNSNNAAVSLLFSFTKQESR